MNDYSRTWPILPTVLKCQPHGAAGTEQGWQESRGIGQPEQGTEVAPELGHLQANVILQNLVLFPSSASMMLFNGTQVSCSSSLFLLSGHFCSVSWYHLLTALVPEVARFLMNPCLFRTPSCPWAVSSFSLLRECCELGGFGHISAWQFLGVPGVLQLLLCGPQFTSPTWAPPAPPSPSESLLLPSFLKA